MKNAFCGIKYILTLTLIVFLNLTACNHDKSEIKKEATKFEKTEDVIDSLKIEINLNGKGIILFNTPDLMLHYFSLEFHNPSDNELEITKHVSKVYDAMVLGYSAYIYNEGEMDKVSQRYLIPESINELNLYYDAEIYRFKKNKLNIDDISHDYTTLRIKIFKSEDKELLKQELDTLYSHYKNKYDLEDNKLRSELNELHYYEKLQMIEPSNQEVDFFIKTLTKTIASRPFSRLLSGHVKNNIDSFEYNTLNTQNYSEKYIEHLSLAVFSFLRFEDNKGNNKYLEAKEWLKTTNLYKEHAVEIDKKITPLNNKIFKERLNTLILQDTLLKKTTVSEIIENNPSEYYLIDFWATWCAPCIGGIKTMAKMNLPKNIAIISLSLDKEKDKNKWRIKTKELNQKITYWLDEKKEESVSFIQFIEMQSIPRYILIDKHMNLIDQAFYHPHEPQFLYKLKNIKNHQYW